MLFRDDCYYQADEDTPPPVGQTAKILRIEHIDGLGCFQYLNDLGGTLVCLGQMRAAEKLGRSLSSLDEPNPYHHPSPHEDVPGWARHNQSSSYYCGFHSMDQLLGWFESDLVRQGMAESGGVMRTYCVNREHLLVGHRQVMFRKDLSDLVSTATIPVFSGNQTYLLGKPLYQSDNTSYKWDVGREDPAW